VGAPNPPELTLTADGNQINGTANFYQGGTKYIRLFTSDCNATFNLPEVEFKYIDGNGVETETSDSVYEFFTPANVAEDFILPLDDLYQHLDSDDDGEVTICIQLESVNTLKNFVRNISLDLTDDYTFDVNATQPEADIADVTVATNVIAWVCDNTSDDPLIDDALDSVEVPGKIYVCIQATEGFEIQSGGLEVDSSNTGTGTDLSITNYMEITTDGETGTWTEFDTVQTWAGKPNLARVSFMGQSDWAPPATADERLAADLTIVVTAQFDPVRRLATVSAIASDDIERRHLRKSDNDVRQREATEGEDQEEVSQFHWGRLRNNPDKSTRDKPKLKTSIFSPDFSHPAMEIATATATTTVLVRGPAPVDTSISAPIAGVIGSAILLCMAGCCFFLAFCCKRRRDGDEEEDENDFPDTKSLDTFTGNDDSSNGKGSGMGGRGGFSAPPAAQLYGGRAA